MIFQTVHIRFRQPVHFSKGKLNTYESSDYVLHSDTIQAALYVCALQLFGKDVAENFRNRVRVSSAFPLTGANTYWLPKPLSFHPNDPDNRKELKKIKYLRFDHFQKLILGEQPTVIELLDAGQPKIWQEDTTQRVLLDRVTNRGVPFYLEKLYPVNNHSDRGLYIIVQSEEGEFKELESLFLLLSDSGIGLQRSLGNGVFNYKIMEKGLEIELPQSASSWVNLSLFRPTENNLNNTRFQNSKYLLLKRGGWVTSGSTSEFSTLRKKSVMMFSEGSVLAFGDIDEPAMIKRGRIDDLQPEWENFPHPIWRDGRAMFLPMKF